MNGIFACVMLTLYVLLSVSGLSLIKEAETYFSMRFLVGSALYGGGFAIWILIIMRMLPLSIAFPVSAGALTIGTQLAGWLYLKEELSTLHFIGVGVVMVGIFLIFRAADGT